MTTITLVSLCITALEPIITKEHLSRIPLDDLKGRFMRILSWTKQRELFGEWYTFAPTCCVHVRIDEEIIRAWYDNGQLLYEIYVDSKFRLHGTFRSWWRDGSLWRIGNYNHGLRIGSFVEWHCGTVARIIGRLVPLQEYWLCDWHTYAVSFNRHGDVIFINYDFCSFFART